MNDWSHEHVNTITLPLGRYCSANALLTETKPTEVKGAFPNLAQVGQKSHLLPPGKVRIQEPLLYRNPKNLNDGSLWMRTRCQDKRDSHCAGRTSCCPATTLKSQTSCPLLNSLLEDRKDVVEVSARVFVILAVCSSGNHLHGSSGTCREKWVRIFQSVVDFSDKKGKRTPCTLISHECSVKPTTQINSIFRIRLDCFQSTYSMLKAVRKSRYWEERDSLLP